MRKSVEKGRKKEKINVFSQIIINNLWEFLFFICEWLQIMMT